MEKQAITLVIGASENPERYSNKAINMLRGHDFPVVAVGNRAGQVKDVPILTSTPGHDVAIDTVTLYLNPTLQRQYYDYLMQLKPRRIIFNPGTENAELEDMARKQGIEPVEACTLVLVTTGQY